jgi:hypothetical protein
MSRRLVTLLVVSSLSTFSSCGDRGSPAAHVPAPAAPTAAVPPVPAGTAPGQGRRSIIERLTQEAQNRPAVSPRPEAVAQALAAQGLPLERWKQVLGSPIGARFCMAGQTASGNVVAVCEFGNIAEAAAGVSYSHKTFDALIPNRSLVQRGQTVLTVTRPAGAPVAANDSDRVQQIFAAL